MAQKIITQLVDDIDGKELHDGEGETITFALDGTTYEIDLSLKNADTFRGLFQDYIANGRRVGRKAGSGSKRSGSSNTREIREWAQQQGLDVPARGRLPKAVTDAWEAR